jgi:hypothetical protein
MELHIISPFPPGQFQAGLDEVAKKGITRLEARFAYLRYLML